MKNLYTKSLYAPLFTTLLFATLTVSVSGCGCDSSKGRGEYVPRQQFAQLQQFDDCDGLAGEILNHYLDELYQRKFYRSSDDSVSVGGGEVSEGGKNTTNGHDYTGTNNHEASADESDWVKTRGDYTYNFNSQGLVVSKMWGPDSFKIEKVINVSKFFKGKDGQDLRDVNFVEREELSRNVQLSLAGDKLYAYIPFPVSWETKYEDEYEKKYGSKYPDLEDADLKYFSFERLVRKADTIGSMRVLVLDISEPQDPKLIEAIDFGSRFESARHVESGTYLIHSGYFGGRTITDLIYERRSDGENTLQEQYYDLMEEIDDAKNEQEFEAAKRRVLPQIRALLEPGFTGSYLKQQLPQMRRYNKDLVPQQRQEVVSCSDIYTSNSSFYSNTTTLTKLPVSPQDRIESVGVLSHVNSIYANATNLYFDQHIWNIDHSDGFSDKPQSVIHKFALTGNDSAKPSYQAYGKIDGHLINQYAMSEKDGFLRVAQTNIRTEDRDSSSALSILEQEGDQLKVKSQIKDIAPTETIQSVRFIGDKGYVVTYRQIDPLFTFDLSDPANPKKVGELKINGFSTYIHPLKDDHLLTIGINADEQGQFIGLQLQIFNVSDMANPTLAFTQEVSKGWDNFSRAVHQPHAFTYDPKSRILSIPVRRYGYNNHKREDELSFQFYRVDTETGFSHLGGISHTKEFTKACQLQKNQECAGTPYYSAEGRTIIMSDKESVEDFYIYTISDYGIFQQASSNLENVKSEFF